MLFVRPPAVSSRSINGLSEKIYLDKWVILGPKMVHLHNPGSALWVFSKKFHNERGQELHEH